MTKSDFNKDIVIAIIFIVCIFEIFRDLSLKIIPDR